MDSQTLPATMSPVARYTLTSIHWILLIEYTIMIWNCGTLHFAKVVFRKSASNYISNESFINLHYSVFEIDCFDSSCQWDDLGSNCNKSTTTIDFEHLHDETTACISHHQYDACTHCNEQYEILNKKYDDIRLQTGDKFCFDIKNLVPYQIISFNIRIGSSIVCS